MKMLHSNGPEIDPWGIPQVMSRQLPEKDFLLVLCFL